MRTRATVLTNPAPWSPTRPDPRCNGFAASPKERAKALVDLLLFTDAIGPKPALSLPDKIAAVHEGLLKADLSHAFGGAIAVAYYGEPRMTKDIDINVFIPGEHWERISEALEPL